jgi:hypothetical protein
MQSSHNRSVKPAIFFWLEKQKTALSSAKATPRVAQATVPEPTQNGTFFIEFSRPSVVWRGGVHNNALGKLQQTCFVRS